MMSTVSGVPVRFLQSRTDDFQSLGKFPLETAIDGPVKFAIDAEIFLGGDPVGRIMGIPVSDVSERFGTLVMGIP